MPRKSVVKPSPSPSPNPLPISSPPAIPPSSQSLPIVNNIQLVLQDLCGNPISSPFTPLQICNNDIIHADVSVSAAIEPATLKKRGRKPKGGKLISKQTDIAEQPPVVSNVILHLKCSSADLNEYNQSRDKLMVDYLAYNPTAPPEICSYEKTPVFSKYSAASTAPAQVADNALHAYTESTHHTSDGLYGNGGSAVQTNNIVGSMCQLCNAKLEIEKTEDETRGVSMKDINSKLKSLKIQLYKNAQVDKKSACFWCTYDFDTHPCYIPKYEMDETVYGYGAFCRPECAVAFLMKENLDDSTKFERYHLLNHIYSKVYDYKKNIKPAPNPYYLLDKFYGNLSIQEYRKLLKTEHMLLVVDKPLTRILPELHEDNDDFILNIYGGTKMGSSNQIAGGVYKVKRQSEKVGAAAGAGAGTDGGPSKMAGLQK
jgi:hypothetical protein